MNCSKKHMGKLVLFLARLASILKTRVLVLNSCFIISNKLQSMCKSIQYVWILVNNYTISLDMINYTITLKFRYD